MIITNTRATKLPELTIRGILLGAFITVIFTASNIYLGLKIGLTVSSSIPAAVISMAILGLCANSSIIENNIVQTQASAAGTLSSVIFILPGLVMIGHWHGFPYWQTFSICAAGGMLGVIFTVPLRRTMVVNSDLPYPEGVAAAEILRLGNHNGEPTQNRDIGVRYIVGGTLVAAIFTLLSTGFRVIAESISIWFSSGAAIFRVTMGFSAALLGAGYLIGIAGGMAMLIGVLLCWGVAIPILSTITPHDSTNIIAFAMNLWSTQVRFIGVGVIAVASIWTLIILFKPVMKGIRTVFSHASLASRQPIGELPRTERDLSPGWMISLTFLLLLILGSVFAVFMIDAPISSSLFWGLVIGSVAFAFLFGFLIAAACGYMAGLIGSSSSPISGIGIIAVILFSLFLLVANNFDNLLGTSEGSRLAIALTIFVVSAVIATATISNDNLQDLKTGYLVGATPAKQQIALLIGCLVGAAVIAPVLSLLYNAYGFSGMMPRPDMDPAHALAAPQATLMTAIAKGIFTHQLNWTMILIGMGVSILIIAIDAWLKSHQRSARLPALAVGIGIYLPPAVSMTLTTGAILSWVVGQLLRRRAYAENIDATSYANPYERKATLIASGLIVGESLVGVILAGIIGFTGIDAPLALVGAEFEKPAQWLGLAIFIVIVLGFGKMVLRTNTPKSTKQ